MTQQEKGFWHKTKKFTENLWADTKSVSSELWEDTKDITEDAWDETKNIAGDVKHAFARKNDNQTSFFYEETDCMDDDCECNMACATKKEKELRSAQRAARSH